MNFTGGNNGKDPTCQCRSQYEIWARFLGQEDPLEEEMATAFEYSCLENPMDTGACQAMVCRVARSGTRLKWTEHAYIICMKFIKQTRHRYSD